MPMYDYKCPTCGGRREVVVPIAQIDDPVECLKCGPPMLRQISAPRVLGDYAPYQCPITGKLIEGRKAHRENLAQHGCRILEPGETDSYVRSRRREEAKLDSAIEATADELIAKLPTDKRDRLAAEMEHGLDAQITRI